jgi:hypothetical protein
LPIGLLPPGSASNSSSLNPFRPNKLLASIVPGAKSTLDGFIPGITHPLEVALHAAGFPGDAHAAAMPDELVREQYPLVLGDDTHQILLDLDRFGMAGEIEPSGNAHYMGIDNHA